MALLFLDSFDHYRDDNILSKWTRNFTYSTIHLGTGRCGNNCLHLDTFNDLVKGINFGSTRGTLGFAAWFDRGTLTENIFQFATVGDAYGWHLTLYQNPDGSLEAVRTVSSGTTRIGRTAPGLINENHWYYIEWQVLIHPSAGQVIVRCNNTTVISASGINTVGDGRNTELRQIGFHNGSNQNWNLDDLYVLDDTGPAPLNTFLGDCRVEYLRPNAPGPLQQWTVVGPKPSHWEAVDDDDAPDDDASYVESVTPGQTDTNNYQATALPNGTIFGAQLSLYAKKSDSGPRVIAPVVNGVTGPPILNVSQETYQYHHTPYGTNPATGNPWTISEVNAVLAGVTVVS